ncbi:hypothetical protein EVAR_94475_1 [Eumeta japonica]|uniref:Uncharacterized protein n=1 Tax=Eumeta variegata TaxID=151549 RepID=A0A4C1UVX2_EUMVA|nr:hypothetical protein EVAR_94475_1 [Eumeta japonica]
MGPTRAGVLVTSCAERIPLRDPPQGRQVTRRQHPRVLSGRVRYSIPGDPHNRPTRAPIQHPDRPNRLQLSPGPHHSDRCDQQSPEQV